MQWFKSLFLAPPLRVLFIGNSLTYYQVSMPGEAVILNDLPGLLKRMSQSRRERRIWKAEKIAEDGSSLEDHCGSSIPDEKLQPGVWDYVVLQENSGRAFSDEAATRRDARLLNARIQAAGARTALFSVWAQGAGLRSSRVFGELACELGALLVPVAEAWQEAMRARPGLRLRMEDGIHPGPLGAYLSACVFYSCFYGRSPEPSDARAVLDDAEAVQALGEAHLRLAGGEEGALFSAGDLGFLREISWQTVRSKERGVKPAVLGRDHGPVE